MRQDMVSEKDRQIDGLVKKRLVWILIGIGLLAFVLRLLYIIKSQEYLNMNADEMQRAAISLAKNGYIGDIFVGSPGKSAHVAPMYAAILGCIYYIFGWNTVAGRFAQDVSAAIITSIGIGLLPLIAMKAKFSVKTGLIAGIVMALFPLNLWAETSGIWEQPYAALMLLGLLWTFIVLHNEEWSRRRTVIQTGIFVGAAALLSPSLLPAVIIMFFGEFVMQTGRRKEIILNGALIFAISLVMVTPWIIRNYYALGGFIPVRSNFGLELAIGNNPKATGKTFITSSDDPDSPAYNMHPNSSNKERARMTELGELAYMKEKQHQAVQWMKENPGRAAELVVKRFRLFWFPPIDEWTSASPYRLYKSLAFTLISLWMFIEVIKLFLFQHPYKWLLSAAVIGPSLIYMVTHADTRYHYPVFGLSLLFACNVTMWAWGFTRDVIRSRARGGVELPNSA